MVLPRATRLPHPALVWILGAGLGGALLVLSTLADHAAWKEQTFPRDQELFTRYVNQLREAHHVVTEHPDTPPWVLWLAGWWTPGEILQDIEMARKGAEENGFLPPDFEPEPPALDSGTGPHGHPAFQRHLNAGTAYFVLLGFTLLYSVGAVRRLFRSGPERRGVWLRWHPGPTLAMIFWSLLACSTLAGVAALLSGMILDRVPLPLAANHLADNGVYLIVQGGPVLIAGWMLLPKWRHFVRVLGLGTRHLFNRANLRFVLGLFAIDSLLNMALYELEKLGGTTDTRDFLTPGLIDADLGGLFSEIALAVIIAPVAEEILFRGILFNSLRGRAGFWGAALFSSLVFGGLHYYSWFGMLAIVLFGILTCWIYERSGTLWPCILLHALSNLTITLTIWYTFSDFKA